MDGKDFDALTRRLAGLRTRRAVVAATASAALGAIGLAGSASGDELCKPAGKKCKRTPSAAPG